MPEPVFFVKFLSVMAGGLIAPCIGEACAPFAYEAQKQNLEELRTKVARAEEMLKKLEDEDNGSAILNNAAIKWKNEAKATLSKVKENIKDLNQSIAATCLCGCLPNCRRRRAAKRSIQRDVEKVEELIKAYRPVVKGKRRSDNSFVRTTRGVDINRIWQCISQRDDVKVVCIHGIAGVGKTAVAEAVYNIALHDDNEVFSYVIWVEASYGITLKSLQEKIMRILSIECSDTDDDYDRGRKIHDEFIKRKKSLVILDFLWENFRLRDIGIPEEECNADGVVCKVILTSRSQLTCPSIPKNEYFEIKPLTDSWDCYEKNLGLTFSDMEGEAKDLVKRAVKGCDGLPQAIIELAHNVRGMQVQTPSEIALSLKERLCNRNISVPSTDTKFMRLECSYEKLDNAAHQQCFLYCALYPKGLPIEVGQLIDNWIWEGFLDYHIGSLEEKRKQGKIVLTILKSARLLEKYNSLGTEEAVKMLDLVHEMALNIICKQKLGVVINPGNDLTEFPLIDDHRIQRASFIDNKLSALKNQPNCPNLSTLLLQNNPFYYFSDNFFTGTPKLKLLDLSYTNIFELPSSICDLKDLQVLRLRCCHNLRSLPHLLSNLEELIVLNLYKTPIEELPLRMERLKKLKRLDLSYTKLTKFPAEVVSAMECLEELLLWMDDADTYSWRSRQSRSNSEEAFVEELACLEGLRVLQLNFFRREEFYEYLRAIPSIMPRPRAPRFKFCVGGFNKEGNIGENSIAFIDEYPIDQKLPSGTLEIYLSACRCSLTPSSTLEKTGIHFQSLKFLHLYDCSSLTYLFSLEMLRSLQNLERVYVRQCWSVLGIIEPASNSTINSNTVSSCRLLKLQELVLIDLPKLESIYTGNHKLDWPAFRRFSVWKCDQLKRLPMIFDGESPKVTFLRGNSLKMEDFNNLEYEEANVPDNIISFVSTKKPESTPYQMHGDGQAKIFKRKAREIKRTSTMLENDGNETPPQSPGQIVRSFNHASSLLKLVQRKIGVLFY